MFEPANSYSTLKRIQTGVDYYAQHRWHFIQLRSCILSRVIYKPQPGYEDSNLLSHFPSPMNLKQNTQNQNMQSVKDRIWWRYSHPHQNYISIHTHTNNICLAASPSYPWMLAGKRLLFFFSVQILFTSAHIQTESCLIAKVISEHPGFNSSPLMHQHHPLPHPTQFKHNWITRHNFDSSCRGILNGIKLNCG